MLSLYEIQRLQRQVKEAEERARKAEEENEELKQATQGLEQTKQELEQRAQGLEQRAQGLEQRTQRLEQRQAPTRLLDYIRHVDQHMPTAPGIRTSSSEPYGTTSVQGCFCPQHLRPWQDFAHTHMEIFNTLVRTFDDDGGAYFPSLLAVRALVDDISPPVANGPDLSPYIRTCVEKPAARVVSKYLQLVGHPATTSIAFRYSAFGLASGRREGDETGRQPREGGGEEPQPQQQRRQPQKQLAPEPDVGVPARWGVATNRDGTATHALVAEYEAAHGLRATVLHSVLSASPTADFFQRAIAKDGSLTAATDAKVPGHVYVAQMLCQAYHYIVTSGLEYGYVASGEGLVLLRVLEDDPNTLYYFWAVFPSTAGDGLPAAVAPKAPQDTSMAYLASLSILAIDSAVRSSEWILAAKGQLSRWPGTTSQGARLQDAFSARSFVVEPPTLPYCTQACIRGLVVGGQPLDSRCPNAKLHTGAAQGSDSSSVAAAGRHVLDAARARALVVAQLARNLDKDCECLDKYGCFGRYGVLFKITVTGYGYTLVAKGVQCYHRHILEHELAVYRCLSPLQGRLVPVCVGLIDLERPMPLHSCASVSHMQLLSYAGPDLSGHSFKTQKALFPSGIDWEEETNRTLAELLEYGLWDDDERDQNVTWNAEVGRVMRIDFDRAEMVWPQSSPTPSPVAAPSPAATPRSPLLAKRDLNAYQGGRNQQGPGAAAVKRPRAVT